MKNTSRFIQICGLLMMVGHGFIRCSNLPAQIASFEHPPINYQTAEVNDAVAQFVAKLNAGQAKLEYEEDHGYLKSVLAALDVPVSSQMLVFSKTSLQIQRISPSRPRAIYFNDDVYVGWCQNGEVIEIAATDANQGPTFYTVKQDRDQPPRFVRDQGQCTVCHASSRTQDVPGYLVRSVFPSRSGHPNYGSGTYTTDQTSPFKERWGGWYVTGTHGDMRHMGNTIFEEGEVTNDLELAANRLSLDNLVSTKPYLSTHSDVVALMVLEHQAQMHNAITFASFETRHALYQSATMNRVLERDQDFVDESTQRRIKAAVERVVEHILMCDEFPLTDPVTGTSGFANEFMERGIRDSQNRSLRDFELRTRLFRYPCSYLIYSPAFDALPDQVRKPIIARLQEILEGRDDSRKFAHLAAETRKAILEILQETKPEFAKVSSATSSLTIDENQE